MKTLRVLVGCEFSGIVREAFNQYHGVYAISCDLLPCEDGRVDYHYQGDVRDILNYGWDMAIFNTPCTFLCNSGVRWLHERPERWELMRQDAELFKTCMDADIPYIASENSIMHKYAIEIIGRKHDQIIQPYNFGEDASKATCFWLKGLPKLVNTKYIQPRLVNGKKRWGNQTDSGQNKLTPSDTRWMDRSRTYPGISQAMAKQWLEFLWSKQ